jgi:hypothetical protein
MKKHFSLFIFQTYLYNSASELNRTLDEYGEEAAYLHFDQERSITDTGWGKFIRGRQ